VVENHAAVVVQPGVAGGIPERAVEVPQGFLQSSHACQRQSAAVVRIGQAGLAAALPAQGDGPFQVGQGQIEFAQFGVHLAAPGERVEIVFVLRDQPGEVVDGFY